MICPICDVQMHQERRTGDGKSLNNYYETWELKVCPNCGRRVKEFYSVEVLKNKSDLGELK